ERARTGSRRGRRGSGGRRPRQDPRARCCSSSAASRRTDWQSVLLGGRRGSWCSSEGPPEGDFLKLGTLLGQPGGGGGLDEVAGGSGDGASVWVEQLLQRRCRRAGRRREAETLQFQIANPLQSLTHLGDDLGAGAAASPGRVDHQQPARPLD